MKCRPRGFAAIQMTKNAPVRHFRPFARLTLRPGLVLFLCLVFGFLAATAVACAGREATLEERAYALDRQLMCPVCDGQTVDQSNAQVSLDMKGVIREKLRAGESEDEILDYFAARYGDGVLASPPTTGFSVVVWIVPPAALVLSIAFLAIIMRRMKKRESGDEATDAELGDYLAQVDRELGLDNASETAGSSEEVTR